MRLTIRYLYPVEAIPRRGRNPRTIHLLDEIEVDVPEASGGEAPEAVRVALGTMPLVSRRHGGFLHNPIHMAGLGGSPSLLLEPRHVAEELWHAGGCPFDRFCNDRDRDLPPGSTVVEDLRDATRAKVLRRAGDLLLVDGRLWVREREPCHVLGVSGMTVMTMTLRGRHSRSDHPGFAFGLDRADAAREVGRLAGRLGMKFHESAPAHEVVLHDTQGAGMAEDVVNAAAALRLAIRTAGSEIEGLRSGSLAFVAEAMAVAERIEAGEALPRDGLAALDDLAASTRRQSDKLAAICAVGRAAVEASRPSPRSAASPEALARDAEDLSALAPR